MADVRIVSTRMIADPDPARAGQPAQWVTFAIDPGGALDSVIVHEEHPTDQVVEQAIRAQLARTGQLTKRTFTV